MFASINRARNNQIGPNGNLHNFDSVASGADISDLLHKVKTKLTDIEDGRQTKILHFKMSMMKNSILLFNFVGIYCAVLYVSNFIISY